MALRGPSLSSIGGGARKVAVQATHGAKRISKPTRHLKRQTLENPCLPDDQWVPVKESILVNSKFLNQESSIEDDSLDRFSIVSAQRLMETLQAIDEQGSAAERWPRGPRMNSALLAIFASLMGMAMDPGAKALAEGAEEAAQGGLGLDPTEVAILVLPVAIYSGFTIYRKNNPRADLGNFLLGIMTLVIFGNILFILVFKIRLF